MKGSRGRDKGTAIEKSHTHMQTLMKAVIGYMWQSDNLHMCTTSAQQRYPQDYIIKMQGGKLFTMNKNPKAIVCYKSSTKC